MENATKFCVTFIIYLFKEGPVCKMKKTGQQKKTEKSRSLGSRLSMLLGIVGLLILCSLSVPIVTMGSKSVKANLNKNMEDLLDITNEKTGRVFTQVQTLADSMMESICLGSK